MSFKIGDIVYFDNYCFTDTGETAKHYGLILLPSVTSLPGCIYCAVITSRTVKHFFALPLSEIKYTCLRLQSYACFDRQDYQSESDVSRNNLVPLQSLDSTDLKLAKKKLRVSLFSPNLPYHNDAFLRATVLREWKSVV